MAVSFSTKGSPSRKIFNTENFLGVDLTNSGTNMDEVRSPNAENMVRMVPGKVRKRTGYKTDVLFHTTDDVNRAMDTSDEWKQYLNEFGEEALITFYDSELPLISGDCLYAIYLDVEVKGDYTVYVYFKIGTPLQTTVVNEKKSIAYCAFPDTPDTERSQPYCIKIERNTYTEDGYCKVKSVRVCSTTKATTIDEWMLLPWSSAPEDNGGIWIKNNISKPVYGCHYITSNSNLGNRVVNVNRVLDTSDSWETISVTNTLTDTYRFGEQFWFEGELNTPVQIEFDYITNATVYLYIYGDKDNVFVIPNSNGDAAHFSQEYSLGSYTNYKIGFKQREGNTSIQIKNFSVMYQKDDDYEWSAAPEDNDEVFHIEDLYNVDSKNTASKDVFQNTTSTNTGINYLNIQGTRKTHEGFVKVSFYAYTTCSAEVSSIEVSLLDRDYNETPIAKKVFTDNINEKLEFYGSADCSGARANYIRRVRVKFNYTGTGVRHTVKLANVKIQKISLKSDYDLSSKRYLYHIGKEIYLRTKSSDEIEKIYDEANEHISQSWQINDKLYIIDGKELYSYTLGEDTLNIVSDNSYIPLVTIGKSPSGGGTAYEPLNMLQPGFYEQFTVDSASASATKFYLSFNNLDYTEVKAWVLNSSGTWVAKTQGTDFSVARIAGYIEFNTAPGESPISGEDNVRILAYKTIPGYKDRVCKCTIGTLYGINGSMDRLFLSGNPDYPNWDFYSQQNDPSYFPDTGYSVIGNSSSAIAGYAIVNSYLATFKNKRDNSPAIFIRQGELLENTSGVSEPVFRLTNTLLGEGIISPYCYGNMPTEPLFLTRLGVYAITPQDITGEKYSQKRSFYLDGALTKEKDLEKAKAVIFKDQYVLAVNEKLYILDGLQASRTDRSEPYATRQYAGFYCTHVPAFTMWVDEDALWIGTEEGDVCRFATDTGSLDSYSDNGKKIYCCWETPDLDGQLFYKEKFFKYFAVRINAALKTSVSLYFRKFGLWHFVKEDTRTGRYFNFESVDFENFSFGTDTTDKVIRSRIRVRKVDKARFRVENDKLNEPLGLTNLALEYTESGNYRGY